MEKQTSDKDLESLLHREQAYFESKVSAEKLDALKTRIMDDVDEALSTEPIDKTSTNTPAIFAIAASIVLTVSVFFYMQFRPAQIELVAEADIARESTYIASLTQDEFMSLTAIPMSSDLDAPVITVLSPIELSDVSVPLTLKLSFQSIGGNEVSPNSFKLSYGLLNIDITNQIIKNSKITRDRLLAKNIVLPPGEHRFTASISDTSGREAKLRFKLKIKKN